MVKLLKKSFSDKTAGFYQSIQQEIQCHCNQSNLNIYKVIIYLQTDENYLFGSFRASSRAAKRKTDGLSFTVENYLF